jgi:hypothetical protein
VFGRASKAVKEGSCVMEGREERLQVRQEASGAGMEAGSNQVGRHTCFDFL